MKSEELDLVIFQGSHQMERTELQEHGLTDLGGRRFGRGIDAVKGDWLRVSQQISQWFQAVDPPPGFELENVTVSLGFNARGQLVFVAEGGVAPTVTLTLKRDD
ncbi:MAG: hypothetical protein HKP27_10440 [Myxococcales bacterium]|nr:hypothetical protein [Myxococcales bacterium]